MRRQLTGLALSTLLLAGCASAPHTQTGGLYHAPARAYSLSLDSGAFRGEVTLTEACDKNGGTLNVWDAANRFFRIDYLKETVRLGGGLDANGMLTEEAVLRGLRAVSDFEYEFQIALMNRRLWSLAETVYLTPNEEFTYLSSRVVKEIWRLGGSIADLVPPPVAAALGTMHRS